MDIRSIRDGLDKILVEEIKACMKTATLLDSLVDRGDLPNVRPPRRIMKIGPYTWPGVFKGKVQYGLVESEIRVRYIDCIDIDTSDWSAAQIFDAIQNLRKAKRWMEDRIKGLERAEKEVLRQKHVEAELAARALTR